jgi:diguanylate cyclase (GGDEF)-like protein
MDHPMAMTGTLVLFAQAFLYFGVMAFLLHARHTLGIGVFVCALGVMHFLETYLAAVFFIQLPFGLISPGSTVMFAGKLAMILLLYIREDAETVRQPIYGLLIGNCLMVGLAAILRFYSPVSLPGYNPDLTLLDQLGALMVWGTLLLFADSVALVILYERLGRWLGRHPVPRAALALITVLSFDQILFYVGLHRISGAPPTALIGGWLAKVIAAIVYSILIAAYLRWLEPLTVTDGDAQPISDLFGKLTYRHRYQALLQRSAIDALTGVSNRSQFDAIAQSSLARALASRRPFSLAIVDVDHFKDINDRYGHLKGDDVLRRIADVLRTSIRADDQIFRYGGEEFVVLCEGMSHEMALFHAERLRRSVPDALARALAIVPTVSIGVATTPGNGTNIFDLVHAADLHLYEAKRSGRNCVVGNHALDRKRSAEG